MEHPSQDELRQRLKDKLSASTFMRKSKTFREGVIENIKSKLQPEVQTALNVK